MVRAAYNDQVLVSYRIVRIGIPVLALVWATTARADFNSATGRYDLDPAAVTSSLDDTASLSMPGSALGIGSGFSLAPVSASSFSRDAGAALEGSGFLRIDGRLGGVIVGLDRIAAAQSSRRVEVTIWERRVGTRVAMDVVFDVRAPEGPDDIFTVRGAARLHETGRATDDGWIEMSTGPIDFAGHRQFQARALRILDVRLLEEATFGFPSNRTGETWIDALEIHDRGPRSVPDRACRLSSERASCGVDGACMMGRCVDAAMALGNPHRARDVRRDYLTRAAKRMGLVVGGRYSRNRAAQFEATLVALTDEPSIATYWDRHNAAYDSLGDGHISRPIEWLGESNFGDGVCLVESEVDLMPGMLTRPMVFEKMTAHPIGERVEVGDVLTSVDGQSPENWLASVDRHLRYGGDPRGRTFITTGQLLQAALETGALLEFSRCDRPTPCNGNQTQSYAIDLAAETAAFWSGAGLPWAQRDLQCDFRFRREVTGGRVRDTDFVGHADRDGIRTILINGVDGSGQWAASADAAIAGVPNLVILDERTGFGGTFEGVNALLAPFVASTSQPAVELVSQMTPELNAGLRNVLANCTDGGFSGQCGFYVGFPIAESNRRGVRPNARIAILNSLDVSGNDYLPQTLRDRSSGATLIIGPVPTYGAFGPIIGLPRLGAELWGGSSQLHDTIFTWDTANFDFKTGHGVEPDLELRQKQSDAIRDVDTMMEAARNWLLGGAP